MILTIISNEDVDIHYRKVLKLVACRKATPNIHQSTVYSIHNDDVRKQIMDRLISDGFYVFMLMGSRTVFGIKW